MARSSSSYVSNYAEPTFEKVVSDVEIRNKALHLNTNDVDAIIKPHLSAGQIAMLGRGEIIRIPATDDRTKDFFTVKMEKSEFGYFLSGKGISKMINKNVFMADFEVSFGWHHGVLHVYREY